MLFVRYNAAYHSILLLAMDQCFSNYALGKTIARDHNVTKVVVRILIYSEVKVWGLRSSELEFIDLN